MEFIKLDAAVRTTKGKGAARRMRVAGSVPAVVYGKSAQTVAISVDPEELVKSLAGSLRVNTPLSLSIVDSATKKTTETLAIVKDHQYDPITRALLHVDFLSIDETTQVKVDVPVEKSGRSLGEQLGGVLRLVHRKVPVICLPKDIPAKLTIDVSPLGAGITFHAKEMTLPEGIVIDYPGQEAIITISSVSEEEETAEETTEKAKETT